MKTGKQTSLAIRKIGDIELTEMELDRVSGGAGNIMKTKHDIQKNSISNMH
jgi:hypothetical protein